MMIDRRFYDEQVRVFSAAGEEVGAAHFIGGAEQTQQGERWSGHLEVDFDPGDIVGQEFRLVFEDGAEGNALCMATRILPRRARTTWSIGLRGNGMPPRLG